MRNICKIMVSAREKQTKKETTRSITYRLPEILINELDGEARQKKISQNVLVKQILEKYIQWDRYSSKMGMIPVPKEILQTLGDNLDGQNIDAIINILFPVIKNTVMFIKGGFDLERCIETLEQYMRTSGMNSDHRVNGKLHSFIIQHDLGIKWSVFTEQLLTQIFRNFASDKDLKFQTSDSTVILKVVLDSDFNEHHYQP